MCRNLLLSLLCFSLLVPLPGISTERRDNGINAKIREEGMNNSQIMRTLHYLADVHGPRLTGSPNFKKAAAWAVHQMGEWGFQNGRLEPWDFGHPGWLNERLSAHIVSPVKDSLVCEVVAWTPSTNGPVRSQVFQLIPPESPTQEELTAYFNSVREKIKGRIVLAGKARSVPVNFSPPSKRRDPQQLTAQYDPDRAGAGGARGRGGRGQPQQQGPRLSPPIAEQIDRFLLENGALIRVNDAAREHGQIIAFGNRTYDVSKVVPTVVLRNEDYGRIARILENGTPVELEFDILNRTYPEGKTSYNAVSEIPGTDRGDEVVMLGGHLDSWHSATGATDNAIGCAIMMEAARILQAVGVRPRRTIRVALWGGEEQGLLGSQAYVKEHFGSFEDPKPAYHKFAGYLNIDTGTGQVRGAGVFGPPEAASILRRLLAPFEDLGIYGATSTRSRNVGGTDSTSFNHAGLPGIGLGQDPIEYSSHTHHTNLDTYERIVEDDVKKSAVVIASVVYHLAMRDELLPRFSKEDMPAPPPTRSRN